MTWQLEPARTAFPAFAAEWDRLNRELYGGHPLFDSRFIGPLLEHFGSGDELLCTHRSGDACDGALILRPRGMGRWALFLPAQAQIGAVLVHDARRLETLFAALPGHAWTIDLLAQDPGYCPDWTALTLPRRQFRHSLTMAVAVTGGFEDYWQSRSRHLASNLRRYQRRTAERLDQQDFSVIRDGPAVHDAIARYGMLESAGWKGRQGTAVSIDNPQGHFYEDLLRNFAQTGQTRIIEFWLAGKLVAARLIILHDGMWIMLKTSYDESLAALAPGRQLLFETLRRAFAELGTGSVEFYTNATPDQAEWATDLRFIHHHQLYRNRATASFHGVLHTLSGRSLPGSKNIAFDPITVTAYRTIDALPEEAASLFENTSAADIEATGGWFANLHRTVFTDDPGVRYYVKTFEEAATAILPVRLTRHGPLRQIEALGNYYTSLYTPIFASAARTPDLTPLLEAASRDHGKAHVMRFAPMDPQSPAFDALLTALRNLGWIPFKFYCFGNWHLDVASDWKTYLEQRDGQLRSTLKRKGKKFAADGGTLEIVTAPDQAELAIEAFTRVYAHSWKKPEPYPEFIPGLVRWLAASGSLRLGIARLRGQPIAAQIWIVNAGKANIFKLAYDEDFANYASGTLLTAHLMEHVIDRDRVREVDYLIGDNEHKKLWMSHRRERWGIVAYNPTAAIGLSLLIKEIAGRLTRKLIPMTQHTQSTRLHWELHPISRFDDHAAQWDTLQRECMNLPFLESAFLKPLLAEFGTGRELLAFGFEDGKPCAATLLTKKRFGTWQTFQPAQLPLGAWVSRPDVDIADLGKSLIRALPGIGLSFSITQLDPLFQPRPVDDSLVRTLDYINTAWVDIDQPFDTYWESRGKNLKTNTRKQRAKLQAENIVLALECITAPADVAQALEDYGALESGGWKGKDGTAVHPGNAQGRFYRKMLENFSAQGRGRIYRYRFNDKVVAMDLCIESSDRIVILKTAYDETYKTVSPSTLMRQDEFQEFFHEGKLKRIEFYGKVMEWHTRWTENLRTLYHATSYRWPFLNSLHRRINELRHQNQKLS
jgi:CelD/BcsL family acetyltransferase involved in cellulose biosynthesis